MDIPLTTLYYTAGQNVSTCAQKTLDYYGTTRADYSSNVHYLENVASILLSRSILHEPKRYFSFGMGTT